MPKSFDPGTWDWDELINNGDSEETPVKFISAEEVGPVKEIREIIQGAIDRRTQITPQDHRRILRLLNEI